MPYELAIQWVKSIVGNIPDDEAWEKYKIYDMYRSEGQSHIVSLQYAGMYGEQ